MFRIDQIAYNNSLSGVHPVEKIAFASITLMIGIAFDTVLVPLIVFLLMSVSTIFIARVSAAFYLKLLSLPFAFLVVSMVAVIFNVSLTPFSYLFGGSWGPVYIGISAESMGQAGQLLFKALGAVSCLYFLALTTPMTEIINTLRKLKIPVLFLELMILIYRFIFLLLDTAGKIHLSQSSRWGYASIKTSYRSMAVLIANLFSRAYWRSQLSYQALLSRGYSGDMQFLGVEYSRSYKNIMLILIVEAALLSLGLYGRANI